MLMRSSPPRLGRRLHCFWRGPSPIAIVRCGVQKAAARRGGGVEHRTKHSFQNQKTAWARPEAASPSDHTRPPAVCVRPIRASVVEQRADADAEGRQRRWRGECAASGRWRRGAGSGLGGRCPVRCHRPSWRVHRQFAAAPLPAPSRPRGAARQRTAALRWRYVALRPADPA